MFSCRDLLAAALVGLIGVGAFAQGASGSYPGVGRPATAKEIQAWDIDVRPDFKGLPKGAGSVAKGMEVWEAKCASCHGVFGESNEIFSPVAGGTTKADLQSGRTARLLDPSFPGRTTLMKLSQLSTLWDYINRAMPWNQPKSLTVEEVYGVTAYLLNLGGIVPDNYVLSDRNMAQTQQLLPNRNGMSTQHAMWPGRGLATQARPDVTGSLCMKECAIEPKVSSFLPDYARDAHGNLAEQNRLVGAQKGADTTRPPGVSPLLALVSTAVAAPAPQPKAPVAGAAAWATAQKYTCTACHGADNKIVGPGFREIAAKYAGRADAEAYLAGKIKAGGQGAWGAIPMPPQALPETDAKALAQWLAAGAKK